jgi:hypothetical protein
MGSVPPVLHRSALHAGFRWPRGRALFFGVAAVERDRRGGRLSIAARKMRLTRLDRTGKSSHAFTMIAPNGQNGRRIGAIVSETRAIAAEPPLSPAAFPLPADSG